MSFHVDALQSRSYTPASGRASKTTSTPSGSLKGKSLRQIVSSTKKKMCNDSILSSGKRVLKDRLELLDVMLRVRRNLGNPMEDYEVPEDLFEAINNVKDHC